MIHVKLSLSMTRYDLFKNQNGFNFFGVSDKFYTLNTELPLRIINDTKMHRKSGVSIKMHSSYYIVFKFTLSKRKYKQ